MSITIWMSEGASVGPAGLVPRFQNPETPQMLGVQRPQRPRMGRGSLCGSAQEALTFAFKGSLVS